MLMVIKNPLQLRKQFALAGVPTQELIAEAVPLSTRTVSKMLNGHAVRFSTVNKVARYLDVEITEIAEFVAEN